MSAYVGTIAGSDDQTSVEDKLHVASTRSPIDLLDYLFIAKSHGRTYSVPAVEICSLRSDAGMMISALLTL